MNKTSSAAKDRWNSANYTQVKVSVKPDLAIAFKAACAASGISMAAAISQFMAKYSAAASKSNYSPNLSTRRQRKAALQSIIHRLGRIRNNEEQYLNNIPSNLQAGDAYQSTEQHISILDESLDLLASAY